MMRIIINFLLRLRTVFQAAGARLFSRLRKEDGKLKYLSPEGWRRLVFYFAAAFFILVLVSQLMTRDRFLNNSFEDYQKEVRSDGGTRMRTLNNRTLFDKDPLVDFPAANGNLQTPSVSPSVSTGSGQNVNMFGNTAPSETIPASSDCFALIEKAKAKAALSIADRQRLASCVDNNVVPLAAGERNILRALSSGDLSEAEKDALIRTMTGEGDAKDQNLAEVVTAAVNPDKQEVLTEGINKEFKDTGIEVDNTEVRGLSKTVAEKPVEYENAIQGTNKILSGTSPNESEKSNLIDAIREVKGGEEAMLENPALASNKESAIQDLLNDVADRNSKIEQLETQLQDAQIDAQSAIANLGKGMDISDGEQGKIDRLAQVRRQLSQAKAIQDKRHKTLIDLVTQLQKTVAQASMAIEKTIPSGVFEMNADYEPLDCKNIKSLPIRITKKAKSKDKVINLAKGNGINLNQKQAYNVYKVEDEVKKNGVEYEGKRLDISKYMTGNIAVNDLFVMKGSENKGITLSPETKIAAMLDTDIMVSGSGGGQSVRIKILQDVYDAKTRQIVIPKNSVAMGRTQGFDEQTGVMDFTLDKVSVGSGNTVSVSLRVGSGDGSLGLKGQIRDTRGRYLLGAFVTSFTAGALDFFTQNTLAEFQASQRATTALTGAAMSGGADVMSKIANMYAGDLQSASPIFFSPRGLAIVLYPEN